MPLVTRDIIFCHQELLEEHVCKWKQELGTSDTQVAMLGDGWLYQGALAREINVAVSSIQMAFGTTRWAVAPYKESYRTLCGPGLGAFPYWGVKMRGCASTDDGEAVARELPKKSERQGKRRLPKRGEWSIARASFGRQGRWGPRIGEMHLRETLAGENGSGAWRYGTRWIGKGDNGLG